MTHQKRLAAPKTWKLQRKGTKRWIMPKRAGAHSITYSMPLCVVLRDMLKLTDTAIEAKKVANERNIKINGHVETDYHTAIGLMDTLSIEKMNKSYVMWLDSHGRLELKETKPQDYILSRVENKKVFDKKNTQLNLFGGYNVLVAKDEFKTGDVVKLSLNDRKVAGKIELKPGAEALVIAGSHRGETAKITGIKGKEITLMGDIEFTTRKDCVYCVEGGMHGTKAK